MAIRKKVVKKADTATGTTVSPTVETAIEAIFLKDRRLTVSIGISSDFGKEKASISLSENVKEGNDPMVLADQIYDILETKLDELFDRLVGDGEEEIVETDEEEEIVDDGPDAGELDNGTEDGEGDELTEDDIKKMKKAELVALIAEEELELNPKDFKKIDDFRAAVIDALFEEDGEEGSGDAGDADEWDDSEWDD
ncbi:MAG: hypothetical protein P9L97_06270 [Candidatus Tenebribacter davisii]|nr:hypothetical protein [Candidatus Tenebribacter davisii]